MDNFYELKLSSRTFKQYFFSPFDWPTLHQRSIITLSILAIVYFSLCSLYIMECFVSTVDCIGNLPRFRNYISHISEHFMTNTFWKNIINRKGRVFIRLLSSWPLGKILTGPVHYRATLYTSAYILLQPGQAAAIFPY